MTAFYEYDSYRNFLGFIRFSEVKSYVVKKNYNKRDKIIYELQFR